MIKADRLHIVKRISHKPHLTQWMEQARAECPAGKIPAVKHKRRGDDRWLITLDVTWLQNMIEV